MQQRAPLATPTNSKRYPPLVTRTDWLCIALVVAGVAASTYPRAAEAQAPLPVTDARTCAALAVYSMGDQPEWDARAERAIAVLATADRAGQLPDCRAYLQASLRNGFDSSRWLVALALVDAAREVTAHEAQAADSGSVRALALATGGVR
jgi:hypothetical protein